MHDMCTTKQHDHRGQRVEKGLTTMPENKWTQGTVGKLLKRNAHGEFTHQGRHSDNEMQSLTLRIGKKRATWIYAYNPKGTNPASGKRWGGAKLVIGDAMAVSLPEARKRVAEAKVQVAGGRDPHKEKVAVRLAATAARGIAVITLGDALKEYEKSLLKRKSPSLAHRRKEAHYAKKAVRLLQADATAVKAFAVNDVRALLRLLPDSTSETRHIYGALSRFCGWMIEEEIIFANPCEAIPRRKRPKPGASRDNVPTVAELKAVWNAAEKEAPVISDLIKLLLLVPLRRDEAAGLVWSEVHFDEKQLRIRAERMKNRQTHLLPLSKPALTILTERRKASSPTSRRNDGLVFPSPESGTVYAGWGRLLGRIRKAIGQTGRGRAERFSLHDIRRSFATLLADRLDESLLDLCLAHTPASRKGAGGAYQKAQRIPERVAVLDTWARMLTGEVMAINVVTLRRA